LASVRIFRNRGIISLALPSGTLLRINILIAIESSFCGFRLKLIFMLFMVNHNITLAQGQVSLEQ